MYFAHYMVYLMIVLTNYIYNSSILEKLAFFTCFVNSFSIKYTHIYVCYNFVDFENTLVNLTSENSL